MNKELCIKVGKWNNWNLTVCVLTNESKWRRQTRNFLKISEGKGTFFLTGVNKITCTCTYVYVQIVRYCESKETFVRDMCWVKVTSCNLAECQNRLKWIKPADALNSKFIGMTNLHVSGSLSAHHQEFWAVRRLWYILCSCDDRLLPGVGKYMQCVWVWAEMKMH
jgi:hypothetical protein